MIAPRIGFRSIFYDNRATITGSSEDTDCEAVLVGNLQRGNFWAPTAAAWASASQYVQVGPITAVSADYLAIAGHNLGTDGISVAVQTSADGSSWTTVKSHTPTDDRPFLVTFSAVSATYWRLLFAKLATATGTVPRIEVANVGMLQALPRGSAAGFDPGERRTRVETQRTAYGFPLGRRVREIARTIVLGATYLTETELDALAAFRVHALDGALPFFLAWDLHEHAADVDYVWTADDATWRTPRERGAGGLITRNWSLNLEAVAE